jgi:hypothetical protein
VVAEAVCNLEVCREAARVASRRSSEVHRGGRDDGEWARRIAAARDAWERRQAAETPTPFHLPGDVVLGGPVR